jgi:hypothetical protein
MMRIRNLFEPGSGMEKFGSGINIPDPQHWKKHTEMLILSHAIRIKLTEMQNPNLKLSGM